MSGTTQPETARYTTVAIVLHWLIALAIGGMIALGWNMEDSFRLYQLHKSIGITILVLTVARIAWRVMNPPPALPPMKGWEAKLSHAIHMAFYGLMLVMPLTGWLVTSVTPDIDLPTVLFGVIPWPDVPFVGWLTTERGFHVVEFIHSKLAWVMIGLVALHVAGAVKHEIDAEEGVLKRMIPGLFGKTAAPARPRGLALAFGGALALFVAVAGLPLLFSGGSQAAVIAQEAEQIETNWVVDAEQSRIAFTYITEETDVRVGGFDDFDAQIRFEADDLANARALVTIPVSGLSVPVGEHKSYLEKPEWFDPAAHPVITVDVTGFREEGAGYVADAAVRVKETTITVPLTFLLTFADADNALMEGNATISIDDLGLGTGTFEKDYVAPEIEVAVTVSAVRG